MAAEADVGHSAKFAFWLETDNLKACEIARTVGYDMVVFDMEHGSLDELCLDRLVPFCNAIGLATYVRVSEAAQARIQLALDIGASGVILPQIRDFDHATQAAAFAKYPPLGARGLGYGRTQAYGAASDAFLAAENARSRCYVMIETAGALEAAEAIAALPTVDGLFIGPSDLSLARGRGVFRATAADLADAHRIAAAAAAAGKAWAAAGGHPQYRAALLGLGPSFVTCADDLSALLAGFELLLPKRA